MPKLKLSAAIVPIAEGVNFSKYSSSAWSTPKSLSSTLVGLTTNMSASIVVSDENSDDLTYYAVFGFYEIAITSISNEIWKTEDAGVSWTNPKNYNSSAVATSCQSAVL